MIEMRKRMQIFSLAPTAALAFTVMTASLVFAVGMTPARAGSVALSNSILLDPYDPVPEIGFRCSDDCGYRHNCYSRCRYSRYNQYRHYDRYRRDGQPCYRACNGYQHERAYYYCNSRCRYERRAVRQLNRRELYRNVARGHRYDRQADRFDEMADRYDRQSLDYDWRHGRTGWEYWHEGRWMQDGDNDRWHDGRHFERAGFQPRDYDWRREDNRWQYWRGNRWYDDGHEGRWHDGRYYRD